MVKEYNRFSIKSEPKTRLTHKARCSKQSQQCLLIMNEISLHALSVFIPVTQTTELFSEKKNPPCCSERKIS